MDTGTERAPEGSDTGDMCQSDIRTLQNHLEELQPRQGLSPQFPHRPPQARSAQLSAGLLLRESGNTSGGSAAACTCRCLTHTHPGQPHSQQRLCAGQCAAGSGPPWAAPCLLEAAMAAAMTSRVGWPLCTFLGCEGAERWLPRDSRGKTMHCMPTPLACLTFFLGVPSSEGTFPPVSAPAGLAGLSSHLGTSGPGLYSLSILWGLSRPGPS